VSDTERKQAEIDYPHAVGEEGRVWLRSKPFGNTPRNTARLLIDFGYILQILDLHKGGNMVELGCGTGWMTRFAAHHGIKAEGYDISPEMIEIARELAEEESLDVHFEVADMEQLDLGRRFDTCLIYDALHHSPHAERVLASARQALVEGGRLLVVEPNWRHRFYGREATDRYGVTEQGYSPHRLKRLLRDAGFVRLQRFHNNRKRLFSNTPLELGAHLVEPLVYRTLAPFWTQIWLRGLAT
jgi:SAM-dependent methyltransferase